MTDWSNTNEDTPHFPGPAPPFRLRASLEGFRSLSKGAQHLPTVLLPACAWSWFLGSGCFSFVFLFFFFFLFGEDALTVDSPQPPCFGAGWLPGWWVSERLSHGAGAE